MIAVPGVSATGGRRVVFAGPAGRFPGKLDRQGGGAAGRLPRVAGARVRGAPRIEPRIDQEKDLR